MTAEEIRKMQWSNRATEYENLFNMLREIAAQLAEIKAGIGQIGPVPAPISERTNEVILNE
jgi:hypothetical protein